MKRIGKNLLSKIIIERVALTQKLFKIKPRLPKRFGRLIIISAILFLLSGYYPTFGIPLVKQHTVLASTQEQKQEIISSSFPQPVILPHPGYLSNRFSAWHPGIDIATGLGMPIHPITSGVVFETGVDFWGLGNYVIVSHQNGFKSKYAHLGKIYVKKDQPVTADNILSEVGLSGHTSGPHTHLEITKDGQLIDPLTILPEISDMPKPEYLKR